ncbi:MAG: hypothetical protein ABWZ80_00475 [Beijerinckiaceae bacterium]
MARSSSIRRRARTRAIASPSSVGAEDPAPAIRAFFATLQHLRALSDIQPKGPQKGGRR